MILNSNHRMMKNSSEYSTEVYDLLSSYLGRQKNLFGPVRMKMSKLTSL